MKTEKVTIGVVAAIYLALFVGVITLNTYNGRLKESVNKEKLQSEKLLSEKLLLTKQIDEFRGEIAALQGKNKEADRRLESASRDLTQMEAQVRQLGKEAAGARQLGQQVASSKSSGKPCRPS
jgi:peptidoglycan hydrolase CwlO-like protein